MKVSLLRVQGSGFRVQEEWGINSNSHQMKNKFIEHFTEDGFFWFRVFGFGLHFSDRNKRTPLFSERNGYVKRLHFANWSIGYLNPEPRTPNPFI